MGSEFLRCLMSGNETADVDDEMMAVLSGESLLAVADWSGGMYCCFRARNAAIFAANVSSSSSTGSSGTPYSRPGMTRRVCEVRSEQSPTGWLVLGECGTELGS